MKYFDWDENKNEQLKVTRNVSFEEIILAISNNQLLDVLIHPNTSKYQNQKMFVVKMYNYAYVVPFVEDEDKYFLKTIYPSREATKKYLKK